LKIMQKTLKPCRAGGSIGTHRLPNWILCLVVSALLAAAGYAWGEDAPKKGFLRGGCPDLIDLIQELTPAVVNISIERHILQNSSADPPPLFRSRPGEFEDRAKGKDRFQTDSLGSGFFCDTDGHIITNAHVVEGAAKILVTLESGKVLPAKLISVHPKVDLALIKVTLPSSVHKAKIGDSGGIRVGEWVVAVGNPFGLGRTVTVGIVSGKGRFLGLGPEDDFIQTDASINPGNSGGPLFNMAGEVIGVNTAIIAVGKGIGFAIPSNYIAELMRAPANIENQARGWLGIYVDDVTAQDARGAGLSPVRGTLVDEVLAATPAYNAGLRKGDLILDADGKPVRNGRHLSQIVAATKPGDLLRMTVIRDKQTHTIDVIMGKSPE